MTCPQTFVFILVSICVFSRNTDGCSEIKKRNSWGAVNANEQTKLVQNPPPLVIVHHSATRSCNSQDDCKKLVSSIQHYHIFTNGWSDIGYNFLIGSEGTIYEGRGWGLIGAHAVGFNNNSIGICLIDNSPSEVQLSSLKSLIACGVSTGKIHRNYTLIGHRQVSSTLCPGDKLYNILKNMPRFEPQPL
ncbi:peptidoglycan recognition protein 1 isoform X2 [Dendroctonus ponderosae]|uniref:Peptidoglycan-recognition protein n=1 Tax=Dendroctonus ponderosae TaxID=77166 RepID=J3JYP9_DENPD|nr:peptidoglycan recognition protein 1 isoform X2 [Dendroctonus ponderosae]AEE63337.1 unknown [Dendroctonus ponderosae]